MKIADNEKVVPPVPPIQSDPQGQSYYQAQAEKKAKELKINAKAYEVDRSLSSSDRILFSKLEGANDQAQTVAQQIRDVDNTISRIQDKVEKMKAALDPVVKMYPPYPVDSEERVEALRQFSSLRKMIDQLTIPPRDDSPEKILGDSSRFSEAGQWEISVGNNQPNLVIQPQPLHPGPGGLDLPELPSDAPDQMLHDAADSVAQAQKILPDRRAGFVADANRVIAALQ
ncbi:MAG: hypothetical protein M0036_07635 [Desulfobacteraceae bacterium]|nr:hypothetical protein [Desulfobacteraceae bacterium]